MMSIAWFRLSLFTIAAAAAAVASSLTTQQPDYAKAERMLTWNTAPLVANDILSVTWLSDMTRADKVASLYRVNAASGTRKRLAFD